MYLDQRILDMNDYAIYYKGLFAKFFSNAFSHNYLQGTKNSEKKLNFYLDIWW